MMSAGTRFTVHIDVAVSGMIATVIDYILAPQLHGHCQVVGFLLMDLPSHLGNAIAKLDC